MTGKRVLMVEDQAELLALISDALASSGHEVHTAEHGPAALELLRGDVQFDVIVSDVSMPEGISGIELAEYARELQPQARMVLVSGYVKAQLPGLPEGVGFLPKPYRLAQLLQLLRES